MQHRLTPEEYFMHVCYATARRSTCPKAQVGAILVSPFGQIKATGYNGSPRGFAHCLDAGCIVDAHGKCQRVVHAEINVLIHSQVTEGMFVYCTHFACIECCKALINAGISGFYYSESYVDPKSALFHSTFGVNVQHKMLAAAGIDVCRVEVKRGQTHGQDDVSV